MRRALLAALVAAVLLAACGVGLDDAPRDIVAPAPADVDNGRTAITATSTTVIYLVGHDDDGRFVLMPVARDTTETINNALRALFDGPTPREQNADLHTAIPASTRLVKAVPNNDVITIDVSEDLIRLSGSSLVDAVGQIVLTATNVTGITGVVITIDDAVHPWPLPDGTTTLEPLTQRDYASLLPERRTTPVTDATVDTTPATTTVAPTVATTVVVGTPAPTPT